MKQVLDPISPTSLEKIKAFCRFPPSTQIVKLSRNRQIYMTTHDLRQLVSHGKLISHSPIVLMLDILCHCNRFSYMDPSFSVTLIQRGWQHTKNHFACRRQRTLDRLDMVLDFIIAIPIFINDCHWVAVCHRKINNRVTFFHADDMCNPITERKVKHLLSTELTDDTFHPLNGEWITCFNIYYRPHSNECGPRTLLALTVMMLHPQPHKDMLLQYMHQNLAQGARCWVASSILTGIVSLAPPLDTHTPITTQDTSSIPHSMINWNSEMISEGGNIKGQLKNTPEHRYFSRQGSQDKVETSMLHEPTYITAQVVVSLIHQTLIIQSIIDQNINHKEEQRALLQQNDKAQDYPYFQINSPQLHHEKSQLPPDALHSHRSSRHHINILPRTKEERLPPSPPKTSQNNNSCRSLTQSKIAQKISFSTNTNIDCTWGHSLDAIDSCSTFRILLQIPNGITFKENAFRYKYGLGICAEQKVAGLCIAETKLNSITMTPCRLLGIFTMKSSKARPSRFLKLQKNFYKHINPGAR